jgi:hypothetical protein
MPNKHHSRLDIFRVLARAELHGDEHAAREAKVDRRTVRRWHRKYREPLTGWQFQQELSRLVTLDTYVNGKPRNPVVDWGVSSRNTRYEELIRRREERRAAAPEPTVEPSIGDMLRERLTDQQQRLLRERLNLHLGARGSGVEPEPELLPLEQRDQVAEQTVEFFASLTDGQLDAAEAAIRAERDRLDAAYQPPEPSAPVPTAPDPSEAVSTAPEPSQRVPAPSEPQAEPTPINRDGHRWQWRAWDEW